MKLSWKDIVTTIILIACGMITFAKFHDYDWSIVNSWRSAVAVVAGLGVLMYGFSGFEYANLSCLNTLQIVLGILAISFALKGMLFVSPEVFYLLVIFLGIIWGIETARHIRHSLLSDDAVSTRRFTIN